MLIHFQAKNSYSLEEVEPAQTSALVNTLMDIRWVFSSCKSYYQLHLLNILQTSAEGHSLTEKARKAPWKLKNAKIHIITIETS